MDEEISIEYYENDNGKSPYIEWEDELTPSVRAQIRKRINRLRCGNFGDCEPIEDGVFELRIHIGPGYRIYYGKRGKKSSFFFVLEIRGVKKGTSPEQKNTGKTANWGNLWEILGNTKII